MSQSSRFLRGFIYFSTRWRSDPFHQLFYLQADVFGAGVDTAVNTLRWVILVVSKFPMEQKRIFEEVEREAKGDAAVGMEHYEDMVYTRVSKTMHVIKCHSL